MTMTRFPYPWLTLITTLLLSACATFDGKSPPSIEKPACWAVLPFRNATETPLADRRAEVLASTLLSAADVGTVRNYPFDTQDTLFSAGNEAKLREEALLWARKQGCRYALTGEVFEWRYKVGVDGEPAVGITLRVIDVSSGKTLWSGAGSKSGWHRDSLGMVAQSVMRRLIDQATGGASRR